MNPKDPTNIDRHVDEFLRKVDKFTEEVDRFKIMVMGVRSGEPQAQQASGRSLRENTRKSSLPQFALVVTLSWEGKRALVVIDGKSVSLPHMPGLLMESLLSEEPVANGASIRDGWHARKDLANRVSGRARRPVSKHALENLISRLKRELRLQAAVDILKTDGQLVRISQVKHLSPPTPPPAGVEEPSSCNG